MKFLCVVHVDEQQLAAMPVGEFKALDEASLAHDQTMRKGGHLVTASALQSAHDGATVKVRNGKVTVTDGPFAETKEQIGGFLLIEATDREEAIKLASQVPVAGYGVIEVRQCRDLSTGEEWTGR